MSVWYHFRSCCTSCRSKCFRNSKRLHR